MKLLPATSLAAAALTGLSVLAAAPATADVGPAEPLPAPTNVTAAQSGTDVVVSWEPVSGATSYTAVADPGGSRCTSTTTSCSISGLPPKSSYTFVVTATDGTSTSPVSVASAPLFVRARLAAPIFDTDTVQVGRSVKGRRIVAVRQGDPLSVNVLLVIGQMHGSEEAGTSVVKRVRKAQVDPDADYQVWTIRTMNPDGLVRRNRYNAHHVDLNRNFPGTWRRQAYTGSRAASEPETRAMMRFMKQLQPTGVLSFHQPWDTTLSVCDQRSAFWVRRTAVLIGLRSPGQPTNCGAWLPGTMNRWTARHTKAWFVTVDLAGSYRVAPQIPRAARAVLDIADEMATAGTSPAGDTG